MNNVTALPNSIEAERGVIGTILNNNQAMDIALELITPEDFYRENHKVIFKALVNLHEKNAAMDLLTVSEQLKDGLKEIGGITYLSQLMGAYTPTSSIKEYALIVKDKSNKRKIIKIANEMMLDACNNSSVEDILNKAESKILDINSYKDSEIVTAKTVAMNAYEKIEENYNKGGGLAGLATGIKSIDNMTGGLEPGDYVILAARPSMGKSAMMLEISENVAKQGKSVLVFSLEMTKEKLMNRLFSSLTKIPLERIKTGELTSPEWNKLANAANFICQQKLYFDDKGGQSVNEIRSKSRKAKLQYDLDLIVIDYIGKIQGQGENRNQELSRISDALKNLAKELKIPIVVLCQLSRAPEARSDHRPMLSDLRESGSIEQDADIVIMLYRDEYYNAETEEKNIMEAIVTKSRDGKTGTVKLYWDGNTQRIRELDYVHEGSYNPEIFGRGE